MSNWISVKDKLPDPFKNVILLVNGRESIVGFKTEYDSYYEPVLIDFDTERLELNPIGPGRVTHWMPLPSPPEIKDNNA